MNKQIPIYRAKKIDSNKYVEGFYRPPVTFKGKELSTHALFQEDDMNCIEIDIQTLAIHFPTMIDNYENRVFASLGKDGIGGDEVEGYCRDCNGDEIQIMHKPVNFKGVVRFYDETVNGVIIETQDKIVIPCSDCNPLVVERGDVLRWSDCRQNIKIIGIKEV